MQLSDIPIAIPGRRAPISAKWAGDVTRAVNARRLIAGKGIKLRKGPNGVVIESTAEGGKSIGHSRLFAFTCRYADMDATGDEYEGWEIYLPFGCVTVDRPHHPMNLPARRLVEKDGKEEVVDVPDWYRLGIAGNGGDDLAYIESDSNSGRKTDTLDVVVHVKTYASVEGEDDFADMPKPYFWAEAISRRIPHDDKKKLTSDWGDTYTAIVGTLEVGEPEEEEDEGEGGNAQTYVRTSNNTANGSMFASYSKPDAGFNLVFDFTVTDNAEDPPTIDAAHVYCANRIFNAAGTTFAANGVTDLEIDVEDNDAVNNVYFKIDTSKTPYEGSILVFTPESEGSEDEVLTEDEWIRENREVSDVMCLLYRLKGGKVVLDNRKALNNIQIYS